MWVRCCKYPLLLLLLLLITLLKNHRQNSRPEFGIQITNTNLKGSHGSECEREELTVQGAWRGADLSYSGTQSTEASGSNLMCTVKQRDSLYLSLAPHGWPLTYQAVFTCILKRLRALWTFTTSRHWEGICSIQRSTILHQVARVKSFRGQLEGVKQTLSSVWCVRLVWKLSQDFLQNR